MPRKKRLLRGCILALLALAGGVVAAVVALSPGKGPPLLAALAPDADAVLHVRDVERLWAALEGSGRFARFREGAAWKALASSDAGRAAAETLEAARKAGLDMTRSRASHLVGREAGAAVWLSPGGRSVRAWVAAFRIDTFARIAELAARLSLGDGVKSREADGRSLHSLSTRGGEICWCRMGDLLVAAGDETSLRRAVANCALTTAASHGAGPAAAASAGDAQWSANESERFDVAPPPAGSRGFRLAAKARPAPFLAASGQAAKEVDALLRSIGVAPPVEDVSLALRAEGTTLVEEGFVRAALRPGRMAGAETREPVAGGTRPAGTCLYCSFRPDRDEAAERLRRALAGVLPGKGDAAGSARAEMEIFINMLLPRVWDEVAIALAAQEARVEGGGFPAEFSFFRVTGAGALRPALEQALRARSLGVFEPGDPLPTAYPYLVKRPAARASVYEIAIRNTRRHEGYRPAVAIRGDSIIFCTSLEALERFLDEGGEAPPPRDERFSPGGTEILRVEWRTPADLRALRNSYDYLIELDRYKGRSASRLLSDTTDYAELWNAIESVLGEVRAHERVGVVEEGGMRIRARWDFSD